MSHTDEYNDALVAALELIWGEGFMAPGGPGNVEQLVRGLDLRGKDVLDIGSGLGGPACALAAAHDARVTGIDLEQPLVDRARAMAERTGAADRVTFQTVAPGPLPFADNRFDCIVCSGAMTQIEDKLAMYRECLRVLRPRGTLNCYDWMKPPGPLSRDMRYWLDLEGLTYALRTPEEHLALLREAGFEDPTCRDKSAWYRRRAAEEYATLRGPLRDRLYALLGADDAAHFIEDWRALVVVCEKRELLQVYTRAGRAKT